MRSGPAHDPVGLVRYDGSGLTMIVVCPTEEAAAAARAAYSADTSQVRLI